MDSLNSNKRNDLQCWRAIAITSVLLFHIWPETFPNGFVGVDIFFALSGFLMAMCFFKNDGSKFNVLVFYYRRIKRIVPIFVVVIFMFLIFFKKFVYSTEYYLLVIDAKWSVFFATNFQDHMNKLDYFHTKSNYHFFRHCWSLAVEMQFYTIFPLIALIQAHVSHKFLCLFLVTICMTSFLYQFTSLDAVTKFESIFSRIWQFSFGILAQTLKAPENLKLCNIYLFSIIIIILSFPYSIDSTILSFGIVLAVSVVIMASTSDEESPFSNFISNNYMKKALITLGDISYVLYLIHWPLITYLRHIRATFSTFSFIEGCFIIFVSLTLALIVHHLLEKKLLEFCDSYTKLGFILLILYSSIFIFIYATTKNKTEYSRLTLDFFANASNLSQPLILPPNWSTINEIEVAEKIIHDKNLLGQYIPCIFQKTIHFDNYNIKRLQYCEVEVNPNANLTAVLIGNSFATNIMGAITSNKIYKKVIRVSAYGCRIPQTDDIRELDNECSIATKAMKDAVKIFKPDVLFIVQAYWGPIIKTDSEIITKNEYQKWNEFIDYLQNYTNVIILNKEQLIFLWQISLEFSRRKYYIIPIEFTIPRPKDNPIIKLWINNLNCTKCIWFDYKDALCNGTHCDAVDSFTKLPLFQDDRHISIFGLRRLKPVIDNITMEALKQF